MRARPEIAGVHGNEGHERHEKQRRRGENGRPEILLRRCHGHRRAQGDRVNRGAALLPGRLGAPSSVVVVGFVFPLRVHALVRLAGVTALGRPHGPALRALGLDGRQRQQSLEVLAPTLRARRNGRRSNERLERVSAAAA
jgi:hypothetical protein